MTLPLFCPHFPSYTKEFLANVANVYWYHQDFSQSRYPPGQEISEACTLICLLVAQQISETGLSIYNVETCPEFSVIMAEAMIRGNATHAWIIKERLVPHPYLNTEEALKFGGNSLNILKEWKFRVFHDKIERCLYQNINSFLHEWYAAPKSKNLFMLLITCGRTVLLIFQEKTHMVTFFDSHSHSTLKSPNRGLVVAQTPIDNLAVLCDWYNEDVFNKCYNTKAMQYELAFLYPRGSSCCSCNSLCNCSNTYKKEKPI